jgi:5-(carboxyamino)imidazole ribonucleotide mutase
MAKVLIVMGSDSDLDKMKEAGAALEKLGIDYEMRISSAHRVPERTAALARDAEANGFSVIIAGAGLAAHLPGVIASFTTLPVIGVPIKSGALKGVDALYAIVQMPQGIPVATVAIDGGYNAGLLAGQMIALNNLAVASKLKALRLEMAVKVEEKDLKLQASAADNDGNEV